MNGNPPDLPQSKTSGLATTSLVLGVLALVLCFLGPLFAIPAVICGHVAHSRIKNSGGLLGGKGLATGGLITGYLSFAMIPVVGLLAAIAIPNFVKARDTAMNNACINQLQQIDAAKQQWALEKDKKEDALPTAADLDPYIKGGFDNLHCPKGGTYSVNPVAKQPTCSVPGHALP